MAAMETINAVIIPINRIAISLPEKSNPNLTSFSALAPNITGIDRKNENSAAIDRDAPSIMAPRIVAPEREVPGIRDST